MAAPATDATAADATDAFAVVVTAAVGILACAMHAKHSLHDLQQTCPVPWLQCPVKSHGAQAHMHTYPAGHMGYVCGSGCGRVAMALCSWQGCRTSHCWCAPVLVHMLLHPRQACSRSSQVLHLPRFPKKKKFVSKRHTSIFLKMRLALK